ncbi:MAG: hypothetical protein ACQEP8_06175 [Chlamydiota bacterium]
MQQRNILSFLLLCLLLVANVSYGLDIAVTSDIRMRLDSESVNLDFGFDQELTSGYNDILIDIDDPDGIGWEVYVEQDGIIWKDDFKVSILRTSAGHALNTISSISGGDRDRVVVREGRKQWLFKGKGSYRAIAVQIFLQGFDQRAMPDWYETNLKFTVVKKNN